MRPFVLDPRHSLGCLARPFKVLGRQADFTAQLEKPLLPESPTLMREAMLPAP